MLSGIIYNHRPAEKRRKLDAINSPRDIAARLDRLVQQAKGQLLGTHQPKGPGRPSRGIRDGDDRTETYLSPDVRDALDRLADRRNAQTECSMCRADVVRKALAAYMRQHLPEAGL